MMLEEQRGFEPNRNSSKRLITNGTKAEYRSNKVFCGITEIKIGNVESLNTGLIIIYLVILYCTAFSKAKRKGNIGATVCK